jgi:hypothetical protein
MHEINVSVASPEAADYGVAELSVAGKSIGYTILEDGNLMLHIEPRPDHGALSSARAASLRLSFKPATCSNSNDALLTPHNCSLPAGRLSASWVWKNAGESVDAGDACRMCGSG